MRVHFSFFAQAAKTTKSPAVPQPVKPVAAAAQPANVNPPVANAGGPLVAVNPPAGVQQPQPPVIAAGPPPVNPPGQQPVILNLNPFYNR